MRWLRHLGAFSAGILVVGMAGGVLVQALSGAAAGAATTSATMVITVDPATILGGGKTTATATVVPTTTGGAAATGTVDFFAVPTATAASNPSACTTASVEGTGTVTNGTATATIGSDLSAGSYDLYASYVNGNYSTIKCTTTAPAVLTVAGTVNNTWVTTLSASSSSITAGSSVSLTALVTNATGTPVTTGQVTFTDTNVGTGVLSNIGTFNLNSSGNAIVSNLGGWTVPGTYTITATFEGSSATVPLVVTSSPVVNNSWTTTLAISPSTITPTGTATLTASVVNTTSGAPVTSGQVTFSDVDVTTGTASADLGTVSLNSSGTAVLSGVGFLSAGVYQITATFEGSSATGTLDVVNPTTTTLALSPATVITGGTTQLTATVAGVAPTGSVVFSINGSSVGTAPLGAGYAAILNYQAALAPGTYDVIATYTGDGVNQVSTSTAQLLTVNADKTTTVALATPATSSIGAPVVLSATVAPGTITSGTPTGTVTFSLNSSSGPVLCTATLSAGAASCTTSKLPLGNSTVVATYGGDTNHTGSSGGAPVIVSATGTVTSLGSSLNPAVVGQSVTYTATVSPVPDGGTVAFTDGGTTISGCGTAAVNTTTGIATCTTSYSAAGSHTIAASFSGSSDGSFKASTSLPLTEVVNLDTSSTTASANPSTAALKASVTLSATVTAGTTTSGTPTGTVTFTLGTATGTTLCTATLSNGTASCATTALPTGTDTVVATYGGDTKHGGSSGTTSVTVSGASTTTSVASSLNPAVVGQSVTYTATVSPVPDGGTVAFTDGGTAISGCSAVAVNTTTGKATCTTSYPAAGSHPIVATFSGAPDHSTAGSASSSLTEVVNLDTTTTAASLNPSVSTSGTAVTLSATVTAGTTTSGTPTGTVTFTLSTASGTTLCTATLSNGTASCSTTALPVGSDTVVATYGGDGAHSGSSGTTSATVAASTTGGGSGGPGGNCNQSPCCNQGPGGPGNNGNPCGGGGFGYGNPCGYGDEGYGNPCGNNGGQQGGQGNGNPCGNNGGQQGGFGFGNPCGGGFGFGTPCGGGF